MGGRNSLIKVSQTHTDTHTHTLIYSCGMYPLCGEVLLQISQLE